MWYLAIDFGTTTSTGAHADASTVAGLQVNGQARVPSVVLLDEQGTLLAGTAAANQAGMFPDRVDRTPKESLGSPSPLLLGGQPVPVTTAVAEVLGVFLAEGVRQHQGEPPVKAVITHPARWSDARTASLRAAAREAGIGEVELCPEPVAAAVHYAEDRLAPGAYVGVYDFGGGTFDTAVLRRTDDGFEWVGDAGGNDEIGGEDLDFRLYELVGELLEADDPELWAQISDSDERRWQRANAELQEQVRRAKESLSTYPTTRVPIPSSDRDVLVTREQFEALVADEIAATVDEMERTVRAAGVDPSELDMVFLAGGSSRIPLVQRLMTERFGNRVSTYADPKLVVSMGAARWVAERYGTLARPSGSATGTAASSTAPPAAPPTTAAPPQAPPPPAAPPPTAPPPTAPPPNAPAQQAPTQQSPAAQQAPTQQAPTQQPAQQAPAQAGPAHHPPTQQVPTHQAPTQATAAPGAGQSTPPAYASQPSQAYGGYQQPAQAGQQWGGPTSAGRHPRALTVLLLGILSTALFPLGIAALALGAGARRDIARSGGSLGGASMVAAGMALGGFGIVVWIAWISLLATA